MATRNSSRARPARRALPDRISLWVAEHRLLSAGLALSALSLLLAVWTSVSAMPLGDARATVLAWTGGGAFAVLLALLGIGVLLSSAKLRKRMRAERRLQRFTGGAAFGLVALWGVAGAFSPEAALGGVSLAAHSAGGRIGGWFDVPLGWGLIVAMLVAAFALVAPTATQTAGAAVGRGLDRAARRTGRAIQEHGPGVAAAAGRSLWAGIRRLAIWLWVALVWLLQEVWSALKVIGGQMRERFQSKPEVPDVVAPTPRVPATAPTAASDDGAWPSMAEEAEPEPTLVEEQPAPAASNLEPVERPTLRTLDRTAADGWRLPPIDLLDPDQAESLRSGAEEQAQIIVNTLASFGVDAQVTQINEGPAITQFGVEPGWEIKTRQVALKDATGGAILDEYGQPRITTEEVSRTRVRVNRITRLADDLALALAAPSIRIEAPVPGQPIVGVEVPNPDRRIVGLRSLIESNEFQERAADGGLPIALGRDVTGKPVIADLTRMPHVLIAGATGSGKSVCINTIISSLLMQKSPEEVRLILVDPKRVELTGYGSAPHLAFSHVVTEPDEVVSVLGVVVAEMDRRYRRLEESGARNIVAFNAMPTDEQDEHGQPGNRRMPYWVVVLDELADMMMAAAAEVEGQLVRLAQLARAVGIHLVVATQRPSVDVVTGLIKANFPTRIAFATTSQTDARVIMDRAGAEKLMGRGDMLFISSDTIRPRRVQGAFVSDGEIERILESWSGPSQGALESTGASAPSLDDALDEMAEASESAVDEIASRQAQADLRALSATLDAALSVDEDEPDIVVEGDPPQPLRGSSPLEGGSEEAVDSRLVEATELARDFERVSASLLQRRMRLGRPRAERLIEQLEQTGVVAAAEGGTSRRVLQRSE